MEQANVIYLIAGVIFVSTVLVLGINIYLAFARAKTAHRVEQTKSELPRSFPDSPPGQS